MSGQEQYSQQHNINMQGDGRPYDTQQQSSWNQQGEQPGNMNQQGEQPGNMGGMNPQAQAGGNVHDIPANRAQGEPQPTIADKVEGFLESMVNKITKKK